MEEQNKDNQELVHSLDQENKKFALTPKLIISLLLVAVIGVGSGFLVAQRQTGVGSSSSELTSSAEVSAGDTFGSNDTKTFKDSVEGVLKEGGINGEGQFHLERGNDKSQYVYLTSSTVDLSLLLDRTIKVWGQTQKAQYAGWLMDVGRVEVVK